MRALPAILVAGLAVSGCAYDWSRIQFDSNRPVAVVANCIAERWAGLYPDVRLVPDPPSMSVYANIGTTMPLHALVLWTERGSWVRFATEHDELVLHDHPAIHAARACAA